MRLDLPPNEVHILQAPVEEAGYRRCLPQQERHQLLTEAPFLIQNGMVGLHILGTSIQATVHPLQILLGGAL